MAIKINISYRQIGIRDDEQIYFTKNYIDKQIPSIASLNSKTSNQLRVLQILPTIDIMQTIDWYKI